MSFPKKLIFAILLSASSICSANEFESYANKLGLKEIVTCKLYMTAILTKVEESKKSAFTLVTNSYDILLENWNPLVVKGATEAIRYKLSNENISNQQALTKFNQCVDTLEKGPENLFREAISNGSQRFKF